MGYKQLEFEELTYAEAKQGEIRYAPYEGEGSPAEAAAKQVGGTHYQGNIEPWDYIVSNKLGYLEGNIIKYVSRYKKKNGREDLLKAQHYLERLLEEVK